jgi:CubicO group peptidase (beta-lactamase class C family)
MLRTILISLSAALVLGVSVAGAASAATGPTRTPVDPLTRIYVGSDGGVLYLRRLDGKVYGFGEHPGKYAYVLSGTVSGDQITARWWDVPKGTRADRGVSTLRWSQGGARIARTVGDDLGPEVLVAMAPGAASWPNREVAGFQARSAADLDGAFTGDDASRHYVREIDGDTVWVAERASQPGERPGWVSVFVGKRSASGTGFAGSFVDVPKGIERRSGTFGAAILSGTRDVVLSLPGVERTRRLTPDYALDWDRFAREIDGQMRGRVVGFAYAIARDGGFMRSGAGGSRRLSVDGGTLPFTTSTQAHTASAAKTVAAAAIVKALHDRGLSVDTKVKGFLPDCLKLGKSMSTLTFRHILSHTSGLPKVSCNGGSPYDCLVKMLKEGRTQPFAKDYNTHAYDLLRWLVPLVESTAGMKAQFELFDCKNEKGILNRKVSEKFVRYVFDRILSPVGAKASYYPSGEYAFNYDFANQSKKGEPPQIDFFERAGSGKLYMTVLDYVRFLSALEQGQIVPRALVQTMKGTAGNQLGFDGFYRQSTSAGSYVWKNGRCPDDFGYVDRRCSTAAMIFPSGIVAYVAANSDLGNIQNVLGRAFDRSLR